MFTLIKLGLSRFKSPEHYRNMQAYIARATIEELRQRGIDFANSDVLELGAGPGGYSKIFYQHASSFTASDIDQSPALKELNIPFKEIDVLKPFPLESNTFDLIYASSLIEHVSDPNNMIKESWRILKPRGHLFISFPPFYSLAMVGGHHFKPFHFFGECVAIRITNWIRKSQTQSYASCYGTFGLHPLKVDDVKKLILKGDFEMKDIYTRMSPINTARWPGFLKDLASWHVCFLAQKPIS